MAATPTSRCGWPTRSKSNVGVTGCSALARLAPDPASEEVLRTGASIFDWREGMMLALLSAAIPPSASSPGEKAAGCRRKKNARSASPLSDRLGDQRRDRDEVLGRLPVLAVRSWSATKPPTCMCSTLKFQFLFATGAQRLARCCTRAFALHAADRRPAGGFQLVRVHRAALHRGHPGADSARRPPTSTP